jgi:hypothetical protein
MQRLLATCVEIRSVKMITSFGGSYSVGFINPIDVVAVVRRQTSSVFWAHLSRFHLNTDTESSVRKVVILNKRQDDG